MRGAPNRARRRRYRRRRDAGCGRPAPDALQRPRGSMRKSHRRAASKGRRREPRCRALRRADAVPVWSWMILYDTIGIDCVAMNVNDAICVGARPISMVDYIAVETADAEMLGAIAIGLAAGAKAAGISICGGETAPLKDIVRGFDLVGTAIGIVPLDRIITGRDLAPGDVIIGLESSGIHSNGLTLARHVFFERAKLSIGHVFPELGIPLGEELLRPT